VHLRGGVPHQESTVRSVPQFLVDLLPGDVSPVPFGVLQRHVVVHTVVSHRRGGLGWLWR